MIEEEILVLEAIYCLPGEVQVKREGNGVTEITLNINHGSESQFKSQTKAVFSIPPQYPIEVPDISLFSENIDAKNIESLHKALHNHAEKCTGSPMLMDLIDLLQHDIRNLCELDSKRGMESSPHGMPDTVSNSVPSLDNGGESDICVGSKCHKEPVATLLLHIDHMRAKSKYVKLIEKWAAELELTGRLLFCNRLILLLLQGEPHALKEYITKHKTSVVDVDSKGHPCKEKMLSVLCNNQLDCDTRFSNFQVSEYSCLKDLRQEFDEFKMDDLFENYVLGIKGLKLS